MTTTINSNLLLQFQVSTARASGRHQKVFSNFWIPNRKQSCSLTYLPIALLNRLVSGFPVGRLISSWASITCQIIWLAGGSNEKKKDQNYHLLHRTGLYKTTSIKTNQYRVDVKFWVSSVALHAAPQFRSCFLRSDLHFDKTPSRVTVHTPFYTWRIKHHNVYSSTYRLSNNRPLGTQRRTRMHNAI